MNNYAPIWSDVQPGSAVTVSGRASTITDNFVEHYASFRQGSSFARILSLGGGREVGAEYRGDQRHFWAATLKKTVPIRYLQYEVDKLKDTDSGMIYRDGSTPRYFVFGRRKANGRGVFISIGFDSFEVCANRAINPEDISVAR